MESVLKILFFIAFWSFLLVAIKFLKTKMYPMILKTFELIKFKFILVYRSITIKKSAIYVWNELLKYHKNGDWRYGQYENYVDCNFNVDDTNTLRFIYEVENTGLTFRSFILVDFDEEISTQLLILASHFNNLLTFGSVKVNLKYHYVEFSYTRDLLVYSFYPTTINNDTLRHFNLSKNIFWAFNELLSSGEEPVFIFSELLRRMEDEK
ncbi:MAG: hypothetical protein KA210_11835 [Bacteroidia bacterium]|nr:hypothetical protein [Bacteroidia bacterium]